MGNKNYIIPIFVPHMGCKHSCVFCNQKEITGQSSLPGQQDVIEKISSYLNTIPNNANIEVAFYGGSFTAISPTKQKELLAPAYAAMRSGLIKHLRVSTRPDCIDEETLALLSSYGVSIIELGVQSTDEEVLNRSKRGHTKEDVIKSSELIKSWGFSLGMQMMLGLPGDTAEKSLETARDIISMNPDFVRIYPALVVKNTEMATMFKNGEYTPFSLDQAIEISKDLLLLFESVDIKVIRIGLQPTEDINEEVIAGPFHPAFRELVESAIAREQLQWLLKKRNNVNNSINLAINPSDTSIVRGHKNSNIAYLKEFNRIEKVEILTKDYINRGTIILLNDNGDTQVCKRTDLSL